MPEPARDPATVTELAGCPSSPNCVCSCAPADDSHYIEPIRIAGDPARAWSTLSRILEDDDSIDIGGSNDRYIRAVATTRILRFKDDVEFLLDRGAGMIHLRSASRIGYSDFGKNRKRMESIRERMVEARAASAS
ncbi:DUF1499 domain-containing protein [Halomonas denitrificans]|nr:DUF1499 domain-containing protein [Halomonas denitrificans]